LIQTKQRPTWTDVGPFPELLDGVPEAQGYRISSDST
jgi:hypothetical protein